LPVARIRAAQPPCGPFRLYDCRASRSANTPLTPTINSGGRDWSESPDQDAAKNLKARLLIFAIAAELIAIMFLLWAVAVILYHA
jgi:hypothetical protein